MRTLQTNLLPEDLFGGVEEIIESLQRRIYETAGRLWANRRTSPLTGGSAVKLCRTCSRVHPSNARTCHSSSDYESTRTQCNTEYRVNDFFAVLARLRLWPSPREFSHISASKLTAKVRLCQHYAHECEDSEACPLQIEFRQLASDCQTVLDAKGISTANIGGI